MKVGEACKVISVILFILDFIGAMAWGGSTGSIMLFLYLALAGFIFCLLIYTLGEIAEQLGKASDNTYEIARLLKKLTLSDSKTQHPSPARPAVSSFHVQTPIKREEDGSWICRKCSTRNESTAQFCKDCGTYR